MMSKKRLIPLLREIYDDLNTPVSAYLKLGESPSFLLESVVGGENIARYSYIGLDPLCMVTASEEKIEIVSSSESITKTGNYIDCLEEVLGAYELVEEALPDAFMGGAVGFFSWDIIEDIETLKFRDKRGTPFPKAKFMIPRTLLIFDHVSRKISIVSLVELGCEAEGEQRIETLLASLSSPLSTLSTLQPCSQDTDVVFESVDSNYTPEAFRKAVEKAKQHIYEGDVFQLVLSQKFQVPLEKDPFDVYRALRVINPSPYMYYFNFDDFQIIGSSPEILSRLEGNQAIVRPIAGTRPRLAGQEEALMAELKADDKELAEHIMLVDLGRNDLGRVCEYNSVQTKDLFAIEVYSHVLHMVSQVEGRLSPDKTAFDLFKATFPAGTLSGAPKVRAIEIIDELEPDKRGPYGGALGFFDFRGNMDLCIIIRTILVKDFTCFIQAGAGIVADSDPQKELEESRNKARGMISACLK